MDQSSTSTATSTPLRLRTVGEESAVGAPRTAPPGARTPSRSRPALSAVAELLTPGHRPRGLTILAVVACVAVLLPVLLLAVFRAVDGTWGSAVLGLVLGLVVDLLGLVLLLGVVAHRSSSRKLTAITRTLRELDQRTSSLTASFGRQNDHLGRQTDAAVRASRTAVEAAVKDVGRQLKTAAVTEVGNRLQATQNLFALVPPRGLVPPMVGYVAAPDVLLVLVQKLLSNRPSLAIECGSGTSTLFLALAAQQYGVDCRLVSLEHNPAYAESTRALLDDHGVGHLVEVRDAPLTPTALTDHPGPWYDPAAYADLHDIGLVFVDGPPGDVGPQARYPLVPLLADRLASSCTIVLDDMNRADERGVAERWRLQLEGFRYQSLPIIRGAGVFTRGS